MVALKYRECSVLNANKCPPQKKYWKFFVSANGPYESIKSTRVVLIKNSCIPAAFQGWLALLTQKHPAPLIWAHVTFLPGFSGRAHWQKHRCRGLDHLLCHPRGPLLVGGQDGGLTRRGDHSWLLLPVGCSWCDMPRSTDCGLCQAGNSKCKTTSC